MSPSGEHSELEAMRTVWRGRPFPLGANCDGEGTNFSLFSENATKVELCLFNKPPEGSPEGTPLVEERIWMVEQTNLVWHC